MTTDKNRITAYINDETFEALKDYCVQNSLSQSAAIEELLKTALRVTPSTLPSDTLKEQIIKEVSREFDLYIDKRFNNLESKLQEQLTALTNVPSSNLPSVIPSDTLNQLTSAELARLLKVNPATISRWSTGKRQPPTDINWIFNSTTKLWQPKSK